MANETRSVVVKLRAEANGFVVEFNNATRASDRLGHSVDRSSNLISNMFKRIAVYSAAAGLGKLAIDAVKLEATYSRTMSQIAAQTQAPQHEMDKLDKLALKLGADTVFSAQDAADAMLELAKGGLTPAQIQAGALADSLTLAAAGGLDLGDAADAVVNAMGAFHLRANQTNVAISALAGGANASSANVSDMTEALAQAGQQADASGLSIADTTAILAAFANNGIKGSDAGTSLKTMLQNLQPQTKRQAAEMAKLNLSFVDAHGNFVSAEQIAGRLQTSLKGLTQSQRAYALQQIFGTDASRAANILANEGAAGIAKYIKTTEDQTSAQRLAKASMSGTAGALQQLSGSIETAEIQIGKGLAPVIQDLANKSAQLVGDGDFERWATEAVSGAKDLAHELTPLAVQGGHLAVDVFPILVSTGRELVDVLVLGAKVATPFLKAFNDLPKSAQDALVLAAGAKVLSSHLSGIKGLAGASGGGLLAFGANAKKAGTDVESASKKAKDAGPRFATLGATLRGNAALIAASVIIPRELSDTDTLLKSFQSAGDASSKFAATFATDGKSTADTVAQIQAAFAGGNVGKFADDLGIDLNSLAAGLAKSGTQSAEFKQTLTDIKNESGGVKGALGDLLPFTTFKANKAEDFYNALLKIGEGFDAAHKKALRMGADTNDLAIDLLFADGKSRGLAQRLKALPNSVETKILTPGALKSTDDVVKLARQFKLTPAQVRTVMEAKDFASGDIKKVLALYTKAEKKRVAKVEADTTDAERRMTSLLKALNQFRSKTIHIDTITNTIRTDDGRKAYARAGGGRLPGAPSRVDSLLLNAAPGEFIVNAHDTAKNLTLLESINSGARFGGSFADGGLVGAGPQGSLITMSGLITALNAVAVAVSQSAAQARFDKYSSLDHSSTLDIAHQRQSIAQLQHDLNLKGKSRLKGLDREVARLELADSKRQLANMKDTNAELKKYGSLKAEQLRLDQATAAAGIAGTATVSDLGSSAAVDRMLQQSIANIGDFTVVLSDLRKAGAAQWLIDQLIAAGPTKTAIRIGRQYLANTAELKSLNAAAGALGSVSSAYGNVANGGVLTASQRTTLLKIDATDPSQLAGEIVRQVRHYLSTEAAGANI